LNSTTGWIALAIGVLLVLIALFGSSISPIFGGTTFGLKHIIVLVIGIVLILGGIFVAMRPRSLIR
jgi:hypothetical protein